MFRTAIVHNKQSTRVYITAVYKGCQRMCRKSIIHINETKKVYVTAVHLLMCTNAIFHIKKHKSLYHYSKFTDVKNRHIS